jgi:hypothetical protein
MLLDGTLLSQLTELKGSVPVVEPVLSITVTILDLYIEVRPHMCGNSRCGKC